LNLRFNLIGCCSSVNTLRHWEQGRRVPEGPTRAYLLVIDRNPKAAQKALKAA
jgi:putative transcriptional regulator